MILGKYVKQPVEVSDYDVDFSLWLRTGETLQVTNASVASLTGEASPALVIDDAMIISGTKIRTRLSGGTHLQTYKVTLLSETSDARIDETEFVIKVKDL